MRDAGKSLAHRQSIENVDVAKLSPAALTAGNAEEGKMEGGKGGGRKEEKYNEAGRRDKKI